VAATAVHVVWRVVFEPVVPYAVAVAVLMVVACVAFATALNHVVLERASHR
jgi:hypothetical protein